MMLQRLRVSPNQKWAIIAVQNGHMLKMIVKTVRGTFITAKHTENIVMVPMIDLATMYFHS
jgi:hypothetical protein